MCVCKTYWPKNKYVWCRHIKGARVNRNLINSYDSFFISYLIENVSCWRPEERNEFWRRIELYRVESRLWRSNKSAGADYWQRVFNFMDGPASQLLCRDQTVILTTLAIAFSGTGRDPTEALEKKHSYTNNSSECFHLKWRGIRVFLEKSLFYTYLQRVHVYVRNIDTVLLMTSCSHDVLTRRKQAAKDLWRYSFWSTTCWLSKVAKISPVSN